MNRFSRLTPFRVLLVAALVGAGTGTATLAADTVNKSWTGLAVKGYDPVAYFTEHKPVKGDSEFTFKWMDASWRFASQENLDLFVADPEKYAPQYGGYCAWAVSRNDTAGIDPNAWALVNGKLYLNYSKKIQAEWEKDLSTNIAKADRNWPGLSGQE